MMSHSALIEENNTGAAEQLRYASCAVSMLPMLAIYPFVQKHFVKGVMVGSLKG